VLTDLVVGGFFFAASFVVLAWQTYSFPQDWTAGDQLLRHTLGVVSVPCPTQSSAHPVNTTHFILFHSFFLAFMSGLQSNLTRSSVSSVRQTLAKIK